MMVRRTLTAAAAALVMTVALGGAQAKDWTKIRFATEGAYEPFNFVTPDGKLAGFDVDIGYALCSQMKAECTMVQQDWDGMIPALKARKFDAIIASMSITEERKKQVDFTGKYYQTPARFVAKKNSGLQITKEGLKGKKVGVQRATIHDKFLTDNFGDVVEVVRYGTQDEANTDLINGRLNAILANSVALKGGLLDRPEGKDFAFVGPPETDPRWFGEGAGIAVRKEDTDLRDKLNAAIDAIRKDGTWDKIKQKYFGEMDIWGAPTS